MSLSSAAVALAAALALSGLLPPPVLAHRSVVIVAGGGHDLAEPIERIDSALLQRSGGRTVHLLLHGAARDADQAIGRAPVGHEPIFEPPLEGLGISWKQQCEFDSSRS